MNTVHSLIKMMGDELPVLDIINIRQKGVINFLLFNGKC